MVWHAKYHPILSPLFFKYKTSCCMKKILFYFFLLFLAIACTPSHKTKAQKAKSTESTTYAQGFTIKHYEHYIQVEVSDPWDSTRLLQRYLLINRDKPTPAHLPKGTIVKIPIKRLVVYTSTHASIIEQLGKIDCIVGVCEPRYINSKPILRQLKEGKIADIGEATAPFIEKIIDLNTEAIIASPFQNSGYGPAEKLGIPIIEAADYMETYPLGRAEWLHFYGLLLGAEEKADSIFYTTEKKYQMLCQLVQTKTTFRPTMFSEKKFGSSWFVPGGNSYMAHFFNDAGANYLFKEEPSFGSIAKPFEAVLNQAIHADYWLIKYNSTSEMSYASLRSEYEPYENFDAFKEKKIYGCNTDKSPYYEEFPIHPDWLLKDLIHIFHPELFPNYIPRYFHPVK